MTAIRTFLAALALAVTLLGVTGAQAGESLDEAQEARIREIVREYLIEHPEVIVEALQALEAREQAARQDSLKDRVVAHADGLFNDPTSPILGNPDGDVTIVEFFDYRCPYCKRAHRALAEVLEADGNIRVVLKEFPVLGKDSVTAARAALAAVHQDGYLAFHEAMMANEGNLGEDRVLALAASVGLDTAKLQQDMASEEIVAVIRRSYALAQALDITGTPAFVVGEKVYPGALTADQFREIVRQARGDS
ncbi:DsbA family protein [Oceanibacterium hippocampi]|uniref:Disulfide bond formation protein D n=1 Tax=Oceanibacterium hippocampi TaxID=745714 RepID=A0A1Y5SUP9_9PROT|nr:DsbA family protein [Oceanibacterium hippocampi]SLN48945.1 Disulfide bond formation protein D precursor [Oceanibacterium hippocampi]